MARVGCELPLAAKRVADGHECASRVDPAECSGGKGRGDAAEEQDEQCDLERPQLGGAVATIWTTAAGSTSNGAV